MRQKLFSSERPDVVYAIGDVHGCLDLLHSLQDKIEEDARQEAGPKWLIMLGDYVDRGPKSAFVLEELSQPKRGDVQRYCLAGNHEETMLDFIRNPSHDHLWLEFGGAETLRSYGMREIPSDGRHLRALVEHHIPRHHVDFLTTLPSLIALPGLCFVHAGVVNGIPLEQQQDRHLLWIRPNEQAVPTVQNPFLTVHGHTPVKQVALVNNRLNLDTGAFMTGRLSAVKIKRDGVITVFHSDA